MQQAACRARRRRRWQSLRAAAAERRLPNALPPCPHPYPYTANAVRTFFVENCSATVICTSGAPLPRPLRPRTWIAIFIAFNARHQPFSYFIRLSPVKYAHNASDKCPGISCRTKKSRENHTNRRRRRCARWVSGAATRILPWLVASQVKLLAIKNELHFRCKLQEIK